mmetsp:Transcript_2478/g.6670  ORF Transcript_2478/g.6670 Transcript_2478/m.6670 type:complete len:356 (-) Transcript_2478:72-1139(-)
MQLVRSHRRPLPPTAASSGSAPSAASAVVGVQAAAAAAVAPTRWIRPTIEVRTTSRASRRACVPSRRARTTIPAHGSSGSDRTRKDTGSPVDPMRGMMLLIAYRRCHHLQQQPQLLRRSRTARARRLPRIMTSSPCVPRRRRACTVTSIRSTTRWPKSIGNSMSCSKGSSSSSNNNNNRTETPRRRSQRLPLRMTCLPWRTEPPSLAALHQVGDAVAAATPTPTPPGVQGDCRLRILLRTAPPRRLPSIHPVRFSIAYETAPTPALPVSRRRKAAGACMIVNRMIQQQQQPQFTRMTCIPVDQQLTQQQQQPYSPRRRHRLRRPQQQQQHPKTNHRRPNQNQGIATEMHRPNHPH